MIRDWLTDQGLFWGPFSATILFVLLFIGVLFWIYRPGSKETYQRSAQMPLDSGAETPPHNRDGTKDAQTPQAGH